MANGVAEAAWLCQLLHELHIPLATSTLVFRDNVSAVYLSTNPVQHQRTKHVEIDLHFVRERVACGDVRVLHILASSSTSSPRGSRRWCLRSFGPVSTSAVACVKDFAPVVVASVGERASSSRTVGHALENWQWVSYIETPLSLIGLH